MEEDPDQNLPITPDSPLKSEELPDEYLGNKKLPDGRTYKIAARNKLTGHDFAVYDPAHDEGLPPGLKATCTKCEDIFKGDLSAMCERHALTPSDKEKTIKILKKCKKKITNEIDRRLHEMYGVKFHWNKKHPDKDFPLPDDVSKWENPTTNELVSGSFASTANLGFTKERMIKLGFDTEIEWNHLNAIWYLNSRRGKCLDAIQKIKPCRGRGKHTKKASSIQEEEWKGKTQEELLKDQEEQRKRLEEIISQQSKTSSTLNTKLFKTKAEKEVEKAAKKAERAKRKLEAATRKKTEQKASAKTTTASATTTTLKRAKSAESKNPRKTQRKPVSFKRSASVRPKTRRRTVKSKGGGKKRRH